MAARVNDETKVLCCHNEFMADGAKIKQAAELFDQILEGRVSGGEREDGSLSYGEEGEVLQVFGDGFSVMYV